MSSLKFEEAYNKRLKDNCALEYLISQHDSNISNFSTNISDYLYCPECKKAKLSYINANTPHLKTSNGQQHLHSCSHKQPLISSKKLKDYVSNPNNDKSVQRLLVGLIKHLLKSESIEKHNPLLIGNHKDDTPSGHIEKSNQNRKYAAGRKLLDGKFTEDDLCSSDFYNIKFFYGKVIIKHICNDKGTHYLSLYLPITKENIKERWVCGISISATVHKYMQFDFNHITENQVYYIAFIGEMKKSSEGRANGGYFYSAVIRRSSHLFIERIG